MKSNNISILVLASQSIHKDLYFINDQLYKNPLFITSGSRLAIELISNFYQGIYDVFVSSDISSDDENKFKSYKAFENINIIKCNQSSICDSILDSLKRIKTKWVTINPIYTLPISKPTESFNMEIGREKLIQEGWCAIDIKNNIYNIYEKQFNINFNSKMYPITGIFTVEVSTLKHIIGNLKKEEKLSLYYIYKNLVKEKPKIQIIKTDWLNIVSSSTKTYAKRKFLPSRDFNKLEYKENIDIIIKKSLDNKRLEGEKLYLQNLPVALSQYFPTFISTRSQEIKLEAIPYNTISELFLHFNIEANSWCKIFDKIRLILDIFSNARPKLKGNSSWLYSEKLKKRWQVFQSKENDHFNSWINSEIKINGNSIQSLNKIIYNINEQLIKLEHNSDIQLIHGDLCFNNILCSPNYSALKLIDPRGECESSNLFPVGAGDSRYDIIKLNHSINCFYDSIVNNLFTINIEEKEINLDYYIPPIQPLIKALFKERVSCLINEDEINILTSSLFFSMLPIHSDDKKRQLALAAIGALVGEGFLN